MQRCFESPVFVSVFVSLMIQAVCTFEVTSAPSEMENLDDSIFPRAFFNSSTRLRDNTPDSESESIASNMEENIRRPEICLKYDVESLRHASNIRNYLETFLSTNEACKIMSDCNYQSAQSDAEVLCPAWKFPEHLIDSCFPETPANETVFINCPEYIRENHYQYNDSALASRYCASNGTWDPIANYQDCNPTNLDKDLICKALEDYFKSGGKDATNLDDLECDRHYNKADILSLVGRGLSLLALSITFLIFWGLRSIRCWRTIIHWNFTVSLILRNVSWFLFRFLITFPIRAANTIWCRLLITIFNYSQVTNFFWMFAEGLYLHMMIVVAYSHDRIKLKHYLFVGWGIPVLLIVLWVIIKLVFEDYLCWIQPKEGVGKADYFYQSPILIILFINALILGNIVRILVTKLRSRIGGQETANYRKTVKAAFILFPLLGVTHLLFLYSPKEDTTGYIAFVHINNILQSFQGLFVSVIFSFANKEVQLALLKKLSSWQYHGCSLCWRSKGRHLRRSSLNFSRTFVTTYKASRHNDERRSSKKSLSTRSPSPKTFDQAATSAPFLLKSPVVCKVIDECIDPETTKEQTAV